MTLNTAVLTFISSWMSKIRKFVRVRFRIFAITQSRATGSTFRYWFRRIVLRPRGWQSASPTLLLLYWSLRAQSSVVLRYVKLTAFVPNGMSLLPNNCGILCLKMLLFYRKWTFALFKLRRLFVFLLMVYPKLFETDRHFILKSGLDVRDADVRDAVSRPVKYR